MDAHDAEVWYRVCSMSIHFLFEPTTRTFIVLTSTVPVRGCSHDQQSRIRGSTPVDHKNACFGNKVVLNSSVCAFLTLCR